VSKHAPNQAPPSGPDDLPGRPGPAMLTLPQAAAEYVSDGTVVYVGNFGAQLFCVGHELIRQQRRGLHAVIASGGVLLDQLIGAGTLASATFGHCWGPVGPSPAWNFRRHTEGRHTEHGDAESAPQLRLHELSLGLLTAALTAAAWNIPFMPVSGPAGTGYLEQDWTGGLVGRADSTFGSTPVVRAVTPDVAFVHVDQVDEYGNGFIRGPVGEVVVAAQAADAVVLVAEEVTDTDNVRKHGITVPGVLVDAYVHQPHAVWPDGAIGRYDRDVDAYLSYAQQSRTRDGFAQWLQHTREHERQGALA
jgi:glutaconate CoA-transferase, subunit A